MKPISKQHHDPNERNRRYETRKWIKQMVLWYGKGSSLGCGYSVTSQVAAECQNKNPFAAIFFYFHKTMCFDIICFSAWASADAPPSILFFTWWSWKNKIYSFQIYIKYIHTYISNTHTHTHICVYNHFAIRQIIIQLKYNSQIK